MLAHPTIHVVLADDHRVVRHGIKGFLNEDPQIEVVAEADDGNQAVEAIERYCPDVVLLDLQMPYRSGIEVTRWVRERQYPVGLLILTAYDDEPYIVAALEAGANGYILKCADAEEIVQAVHTVASGGCVMDRKIMPKLMSMLAHLSETQIPCELLSQREVQVLNYAAHGLTNKGIAVQLNLSHRTIQGHLRRIFDKLRVANRTEAVTKATQLNILQISR